ncbi:hypothetical protein ACH4RA_26700 [Streptomyces smyrnaeus]|uniref:hypothetical protein n=1 Tax=Streptomyces TaxID=1883 RepID=UPI001B387A73|nr:MULTISPECIES: hypothetical protein [unclassified Streptomyces]MBQ0865865.1 hypothetical protein [Streptomyces sp. RK75]MBQ1123291.1 hypothetical protein [Streptomyces sp. B15]
MTASAGLLFGAGTAAAGDYCAPGYHCVFEYDLGSSRYSFFNTDPDFRNNYFSDGTSVHNNVWAASNSSTGGYESHYYTGVGTDWGGFLFCVNPGDEVSHAQLSARDLDDRASSLRLRGTTSVRCL